MILPQRLIAAENKVFLKPNRAQNKLRPFNSFNTEMKYPLLSALFHPLFQRFADRPVVEIREYEIVFLTGSVTLDNLQRSIQQFHLERHFCLVPFGQYPLLTIHFYDVAIG